MNSTKDFKFYLKDIEPSIGAFTGLASTYGNVDLGGDIVEQGAFTRTIKNSGGKVPLLWQHDQREPIGIGTLSDSKEGLAVTGQLVLESPVARKALALIKAKVLGGMSIGYDTVAAEYDKQKEVRRLKEVKLWEVSLVTFPMNPKAQFTGAKALLDNFASMIECRSDDVVRGRTLSADERKHFMQLQAKISALLEVDPEFLDSTPAPAEESLSDPDIHSLLNHLERMVQ